MNEHDEIDPYTESDPEKLRAEVLSLRGRLELRAVEVSVLRVALDTIGRCANAQGRRFTVAIVAVFDDPLGDVPTTSILVSDPGYDEEGIGRAIGAVLSPILTELAEARIVEPRAEDLLDVLAELDAEGVLESTYNLDPQRMHDDVACDDIPPFEAALYAWRNAGHPVYVGDSRLPIRYGGATGIEVTGQSGRRYVVEGDIDAQSVPVAPGPVPTVPGLRPIPGGKDRKK